MDKQHPYNNSIENKLAQLPDADAEQLWDGMQTILDKKMPQQKERRRFLGWLITNKTLLALSAASIITACCLVFVYTSPAKTTTDNNLSKLNTDTKQTASPIITTESAEKENENSAATQTNNTVKENTALKTNNSVQQGAKKLPTALPAFPGKTHTNTKEGNGWPAANHTFKKSLNGKAQSQLNNSSTYNEAFVQTEYKTSKHSLHTALVHHTTYTMNFIKPLALDDSTYSNPLRNLLLQQRAATAKRIKKNSSEKGPYVGLLAGMDLSSVQFQSMKTGVNKGLIAGYEFTKKWSIESGLFWNKKRYVGDGSAFHPSGYTLPAGVTMLSVNGECQLYEWPVNVKFTIIPKKNSLFVTAGLSSYYMKTESYNYEYEQNGQEWKSYASYKNETKDWFSVANFSLGYMYQIGERSSLRVEPYLKLPIRDIGINNMPVVSTGLNVGFTKQILR